MCPEIASEVCSCSRLLRSVSAPKALKVQGHRGTSGQTGGSCIDQERKMSYCQSRPKMKLSFVPLKYLVCFTEIANLPVMVLAFSSCLMGFDWFLFGGEAK